MLFRKRQEYKVEPFTPQVSTVEPVKVDIEDTNYITNDSELVFKLQDKFSIKDIHFDKITEIKTFVFNAKISEIEEYLKQC
jgi:hypothetical protein